MSGYNFVAATGMMHQDMSWLWVTSTPIESIRSLASLLPRHVCSDLFIPVKGIY